MKCRKFVKTCLAVMVLSVLASSCSKQEVQDSEPVPETKGVIGITCMDLGNPFFKLISQVMEDEAKKYGYTVLALGANNDPSKQDTQIANFIAQDCAAIFLNPVDSKALGQAVKKAHEAGIPVFTFDVQVSAEEAKDLIISHIGSDNYQGGRLAGESMMKATGDKGKIAIIDYPEVTSCKLRVKGFKDYLKEHNSKLEIVATLSGKGKRDVGLNVATDILQGNSDIVGIFAINDPSALGAYAAISSESKLDQITIVAFDASPAGKQGVFEKKLFDTPQQFPRQMAKGTVEAFIKHLEGKEVKKINFILCKHYYYEDSVNDKSRIEEQW